MKDASSQVFYPSLADWQTASMQDGNSVSVNPAFVSALQPEPTNAMADNLGTPIAWITTDVLGAVRAAIPDVGAYEFPSTIGIDPVSVADISVAYPNPFSTELNINLNNNSSSEIILFNSIAGKQLTSTFNGSIVIDTRKLKSGIYFYEVHTGNKLIARGKIIRQ